MAPTMTNALTELGSATWTVTGRFRHPSAAVDEFVGLNL